METECNGSVGVCELPYSHVVHAMAHNAMSSSADGFALPNHLQNMKSALESGVHGLMLDLVLDSGGRAKLCHGDCALGSTELARGLRIIKDFLDSNPREVVTVVWELAGGDPSGVLKLELAQVVQDLVLEGVMYQHSLGSVWPSLGEMIESGRRLVFFTPTRQGKYAWDNFASDFITETPWNYKSRSDMEQGCEQRGTGARDLFLLNHFLTNPLPSPSLAASINYNPLLLERARRCEAEGRVVTFVAVDFWSLSHVVGVVSELNAERVARARSDNDENDDAEEENES